MAAGEILTRKKGENERIVQITEQQGKKITDRKAKRKAADRKEKGECGKSRRKMYGHKEV